MNFAPTRQSLALAIALALAGCGGGSAPAPAAPVTPVTPVPPVTPVTPAPPLTTLSGVVVDGDVRGATVFFDANNNGILDAGETSAVTDATGRYSLALAATPAQLNGAHLRVTGGTDTSTGAPFTHTMGAIVDDAANRTFVPITPLSTLVDGMVAGGAGFAQAREALVRVIGVSSAAVLDKDPLPQASSEPALLQKMVALQKAMEVLASADRNGAEKISDGAVMIRVSSAVGAEIIRLAAAMAPAQAGVAPVPPSVAAIVAGTVENQARLFAAPASVRAAASLAADVANLTEATVAIGVGELLKADPAANLASLVDARLTAIASLQRQAIAAATLINTTPPAAGTPALRLADVAAAAGADAGLLALVQATGALTAVPPASASAPTELAAARRAMAAVQGQPPAPADEPAIARQLDASPGNAAAPTAWNAAGSKVTFHDDANVASYAVISNFGANDAIAFSASAQTFVSVASQGSNVTLTVNRGGVVSSIVLQNVISAGQVVYDVASFNALPVGDISFTGSESVQAVALDSRGGTLTSPATVDAANGSFALTDDALLPGVIRLTGFGANDSLQWLHASAGQVAVSSKGGDAVLVVNQAGVISSVTIVGVVPAGAVVYDVASFNALAVGKILF